MHIHVYRVFFIPSCLDFVIVIKFWQRKLYDGIGTRRWYSSGPNSKSGSDATDRCFSSIAKTVPVRSFPTSQSHSPPRKLQYYNTIYSGGDSHTGWMDGQIDGDGCTKANTIRWPGNWASCWYSWQCVTQRILRRPWHKLTGNDYLLAVCDGGDTCTTYVQSTYRCHLGTPHTQWHDGENSWCFFRDKVR